MQPRAALSSIATTATIFNAVWVDTTLYVNDGVNGNVIIANGLVLNSWTHVAIVRSSGTITAYLNGTSVGSSPLNPGALQHHLRLYIGARPANVALSQPGFYQ